MISTYIFFKYAESKSWLNTTSGCTSRTKFEMVWRANEIIANICFMLVQQAFFMHHLIYHILTTTLEREVLILLL